MLPAAGELSPALIARVIARRIARFYTSERIAAAARFPGCEGGEPVGRARPACSALPHFCSGCPHNSSTKVPEGSRALAGIGCHYMAIWINPTQTQTFSQMGGEGAAWVGQAPFTETKHVFANIGDGTYAHSGLLAIRQAVAAKVPITYKILFNDAVAMTGGQPVDGTLTVPQVVRQVQAEGVERVVVVTDEPEKYAAGDLPDGRRRASPPRARRRAARAAGVRGRLGARVRPDLRRREAPPPQARPLSRSGAAGRHQRPGVRGLRRLQREVELHVGRAARNRVRPQARDRPILLQQGLFLPRRLLPELRDRRRRLAAPGPQPGAVGRTGRGGRRGVGRGPGPCRRAGRDGRAGGGRSPPAHATPPAPAELAGTGARFGGAAVRHPGHGRRRHRASSPSARCSARPRASSARARRCWTWRGWRRRAGRSGRISASRPNRTSCTRRASRRATRTSFSAATSSSRRRRTAC